MGPRQSGDPERPGLRHAGAHAGQRTGGRSSLHLFKPPVFDGPTPVAYGRHVDDVEALGVLAVASAHGPILTADAIHESFNAVRALAGRPIIPGPGQEMLDELLAAALVGTPA